MLYLFDLIRLSLSSSVVFLNRFLRLCISSFVNICIQARYDYIHVNEEEEEEEEDKHHYQEKTLHLFFSRFSSFFLFVLLLEHYRAIHHFLINKIRLAMAMSWSNGPTSEKKNVCLIRAGKSLFCRHRPLSSRSTF